MKYLHPCQRGSTYKIFSGNGTKQADSHDNPWCNLVRCKIFFSCSYTRDTGSDWLAVFQSGGDIRAVSPPALLLYKHDVWWHLSWNLQCCRTVSYLNSSMFTAVFPPPLPICTEARWQLTAFSSVNALMFDMLVHGLYLVTGAKVSWLALRLSSALQPLKWTCTESTLKNYFSRSRR